MAAGGSWCMISRFGWPMASRIPILLLLIIGSLGLMLSCNFNRVNLYSLNDDHDLYENN
jgi:hypothetical protein